MANVIKNAINKFTKGLVMDFSPENTQNELLTHALNATLVTFNGNELSLQNDMGNARIETAYLPEGYMPVGTCEYGGIIYIVSYNPLENKSQIGCFPSPERNISSDELGKSDTDAINNNDFQLDDGEIKNTSKYVLLRDSNLNPGDKFLVSASESIYNEKLSDLFVKEGEDFNPVHNPIIKLNIVSIEDSGKINYLNSDVRQYEVGNNKYHILGKLNDNVTSLQKKDIDAYRSTLSSGYNVFKSKTSGKLAILAELVTIDSYSVTHSLKPKKDEQGNILDGVFDVVIHTEVEPIINSETYNILPKLRYYYLKESQGQLQVSSDTSGGIIYLFNKNNNFWKVNSSFLSTTLNKIYVPTVPGSLDLSKKLEDSGKFNFPRPGSYHCKMENYNGENTENMIYTKFYESKFHRIKKIQITPAKDNNSYDYSLYNDYYKGQLQAEFYEYNNDDNYTLIENKHVLNDSYDYYILSEIEVYENAKRDSDKYKNKGITLYKVTTEAAVAGEKEINDGAIEKWIFQDIITYRLATNDDKENPSGLKFYTKDGDSYIEYKKTEFESGVTYYVQETESTLVSVGTEVDMDEYTDVLYYYPTTKYYAEASDDDLTIYWDFSTYPKTENAPYGCPITLYAREVTPEYIEATEDQKNNYKEYNLQLYYKSLFSPVDLSKYNDDTTGKTEEYTQLFITFPVDTYVPNSIFQANAEYNDIDVLSDDKYGDKVAAITRHVASDFILDNPDENSVAEYEDVKLATIKIPNEIHSNGLDLPFKYDYTIIPCMNFGKLEHLAVSNTVDFSKLHAFNQSNFNVWKYHIDGSDLRLTFGAEIYDTYENNKVDALVLEFYDLWGFAGSLEITGKKSYSGRFTKLIPMNQLNALSKKKISGNKYVTSFSRNIGILDKPKDGEQGTQFIFNDKEIYYSGADEGWKYTNGQTFESENNDCGAIYSNIVYGVKTYLRVTENNEYKFIPKKHFVLYTLPIYNDYYYSCNDFSNLENPKLDLVLTFKMVDSSALSNYKAEGFSDGYINEHKELVGSYLGGTYDKTTLDVHKYIKYKGTSNLFLEIGLKEEYKNVNINYYTDINNYFSCDLQLIGSNNVLDIKYDETQFTNLNDALGYTNVTSLSQDLNKIGFDSTYSVNKKLNNKDFKDTNFLHYHGKKPVQINYEFVVGYRSYVKDIHESYVPATTVCALCHKISNSSENDGYNYTDFGIYKSNDLYLSAQMFYNEGTASNTIFGICKQTKTEGDASEQLSSTIKIDSISDKITSAGTLNKGNPLKEMSQYIGKLAFCSPHAHCINLENGVSIQSQAKYNSNYASWHNPVDAWNINNDYVMTAGIGNRSDTDSEGINWDMVIKYAKNYDRPSGISIVDSKTSEDTLGTLPGKVMYYYPKYNMVLNTKNTLIHNGLFISTLERKLVSDNHSGGIEVEYGTTAHGFIDVNTVKSRRIYTGISGKHFEQFNKCMINTFKSVYAYNPEYDSLPVKIGIVNVQNNPIQFCSNVISANAKLQLPEDKTFNDYIFLGSMLFSKYLTHLLQYSENNQKQPLQLFTKDSYGKLIPTKQLQFLPNLRYCGEEGSNYLVTSLTYNTQTPQFISDELEYKATDKTVVKHEDGTVTYINGIPNKKALYAFDKDKELLIQLDVSNYKINQIDGTLSLIGSYTTTTNSSNWQSGYNNNNNNFNDVIQTPSLSIDGTGGSSSTNNTTQKNEGQIRSTELTTNYSSINSNDVYIVDSSYKNSCLVGTTLTLNDLEYEPDGEHKLFVKDSTYIYKSSNTPIVFYRTMSIDEGKDSSKWATNQTWNYNNYGSYNWLSFYTGPCFIYKYWGNE